MSESLRVPRDVRDDQSRGESAFADTNDLVDPLDRAIARELWRWQASAETDRVQICSPQSDLSMCLEYYLCAAFQCDNSAPPRGWWCDGVVELSIEELDRTSFQIVGAAYWVKSGHKSSRFYLAAFEIEMCFPSPDSETLARSIIRFGASDHHGYIEKTPHNADATRLIAKRPRRNPDWAFAVELT